MKFAIFRTPFLLGLLAGCASHHAAVQEPARTTEIHYPYNKPLSTPGWKFGALPQAAQNTVRTEAGTAEIADVKQDIVSGHLVYKIYFQDALTFPTLYIGADGSVLYPDLTVAIPAPHESPAVKFSDLPLSVAKVLQERAPESEIASIRREYWGDHMVYTVSFKNELRYPKLCIVADGTMLIKAP